MFEVEQTDAFAAWLSGLDDNVTAARIHARLRRFQYGLLGDAKPVGEGVWEARLDFGPGWRLYYVRRGERLIIMLAGGSKRGQARDIERAKASASELEP